jgi:hypothetical protein
LDLESKIRYLEEQHRRLDLATSQLETKRDVDRSDKTKLDLVELKKKKLAVRDELAALRKELYENQFELNFSDYDR